MQHIKLWVHAALYALVKVHHCTEKLTNTNQESKRALLTPYRKRTETYTSQAEPVAANSRAVGQFLPISCGAFILLTRYSMYLGQTHGYLWMSAMSLSKTSRCRCHVNINKDIWHSLTVFCSEGCLTVSYAYEAIYPWMSGREIADAIRCCLATKRLEALQKQTGRNARWGTIHKGLLHWEGRRWPRGWSDRGCTLACVRPEFRASPGKQSVAI